MKRKVNRVGTNTLTVSLPSKWARQFNIKPGDEIELVEIENSIVINGSTRPHEKKEIIFNLDETKELLVRMLCAPYLKGYSTIKLYYSDPKYYKKVQKYIKYLVGFEIVEQGKNFVKLEEISAGSEEQFHPTLIRLFHILKSFLQEVHNYLQKPYENVQDILDTEFSCDRLSLYCKRLLNKNQITGKAHETFAFYSIVTLIEMAGDELKEIIEYFVENNPKNYRYDKKLDPLFQGLEKVIDITIKKINNYTGKKDYNKQVVYALEQRNIRKTLKENRKSFLKNLDKDNIHIYWHLVNFSEHIQHMSQELF